MFGGMCNFFQQAKETICENRVAAFVGGSLLSLSTSLTLYYLQAGGVIMSDMNDDAAQGIISAIGATAFVVGAAANVALHAGLKRCTEENSDDLERAAINTPGMRSSS